MSKTTVFIIGAGMVGAATAQAISLKEIVQDIALIDTAKDQAYGQAMDINHAAAYTHSVRVRVGKYEEIKENDIVVITCGAPQKPGQNRLDLLPVNAQIIKNVVAKITAQGKSVCIIVVSNPVDVLTRIALEVSGLPPERVFGTGTTLDTARLRVKLANDLNVSQQLVEAYVLGEHGNSSFPALSSATIGGVPLALFPGFDEKIVATIETDIRQAAHKIIEAKKSTYYGIGHAVAKLVEALMHETASIYPICSLATGEYGLNDVVIGLPNLVSSKGVSILERYPLNDFEKQRLEKSAGVIREAYKNYRQREDAVSLQPRELVT